MNYLENRKYLVSTNDRTNYGSSCKGSCTSKAVGRDFGGGNNEVSYRTYHFSYR